MLTGPGNEWSDAGISCPETVVEVQGELARWIDDLAAGRFELLASLYGFAGQLQLPAGWSVQQRLPAQLIYLVLHGTLEGEHSGRALVLQPGDLLWVDAGETLSLRPRHGQPTVARLRFDALQTGKSGRQRTMKAPYPALRLSGAQPCASWLAAIAAELMQGLPLQEVRIRALLLCLFTEMHRVAVRHHAPRGQLTPGQWEEVLKFLEMHGEEAERGSIGPVQLARALDFSPDYFTRSFSRTCGQSPRAFLAHWRMQRAALRLIESRQTVTQVAREFGYEDAFAFSKQFKKSIGKSPLRFRKEESKHS